MMVLFRRAAMLAALCLPTSVVSAQSPAESTPTASLLATSTAEGVRESLGGAIDRIVRARLDALGVLRVQGSVALDVSEVQLALGCVGETPECLGQVAEQLDVDVLLLPNLDRVGDELILSVARFDRASGDIRRVARRAVGDDAETQLLEAVDGLLRELFDLPPPPPEEVARSDDAADGREGGEAALGEATGDAARPPPAPPAGPALIGPAIVIGAGVLTLGAGVVTGALFLGEADAYAVPPETMQDVLERDAHRASAEDLALATNVLLVAGGVVAAAGVGWLLVEVIGASGGSGEGTETTLVPLLGPQMAGLEVAGSLPEIP